MAKNWSLRHDSRNWITIIVCTTEHIKDVGHEIATGFGQCVVMFGVYNINGLM